MSPRALTVLLLSSAAAHATEATPQQVADFWNTVFKGAPPNGVPPLNASRTNSRMVGNVRVWDVAFDSYRDPSTNLPVRIGGYFALPPTTFAAPGPGGTYPGFVNTHSVGGCASCGSPQEGLNTAVYYAQKGYAALTFYVRGYALSPMSNPADNSPANSFFCRYLPDDTQQPFNTSWTGYAVDVYQAGELMAAQPEVWASRGLAMTGHSLGGYVAAIAGIFSERYRFIAASAPPTTGTDIAAWMASGNPIASCLANLPGGYTGNVTKAIRMVSFMGVYQAINSPLLVAKDPTWKLDNTETLYYGGQFDTAVPAGDVQASYRRADTSNNFAFHWSPTGGHGGAHHYSVNKPSDPVVETVLRSGRTVWRASFLSRVQQNMVLLAIQQRAEREMCDSSHAYRIDRSRFTALRAAALNVRKCPFVVPIDIVAFFKSVSAELAEAAIERMLKWVHWPLRRVICWLLKPPVVLRPDHPQFRPHGSMEYRFLKGLPEGGVLPPFAANIVADAVVGRPFEGLEADVRLVRFSDNILPMGRSASQATAAVELIAKLLAPYGLCLHEPWPTPVDLRVTPVEWLGKRLHGSAVQTFSRDVKRYVRELSEHDPASHTFRWAARRAMTELSLDGPRRLDYVSRRLSTISKAQARSFDLLRCARLPMLPDSEPDDFDEEATS